MYDTYNQQITKTVTQEKWTKGRNYVLELQAEIKNNYVQKFQYKILEQIRGFFYHLAMVFEIFFPYLRGFHLTLAKYLPKRDDEGWKLSELQWIGYIERRVETGAYTRSEEDLTIDAMNPLELSVPDTYVKPVPRLYSCLIALATFMKLNHPSIITVRSEKTMILLYGFVDTS